MAGVDRVTFAREARKYCVMVCPSEKAKKKVGNSTATVQDIKEFLILVSKEEISLKFENTKNEYLVKAPNTRLCNGD